ncbi:unnamed protein product [Peronospora destructor]|uniref:Uncharacterized protein n=1 Tax=Peronospora destructor TaxID=86335 RepID=A0AAV0UIG6_9STRA|nr:unnamed protein product [Peronospora destructor]
MAAQSDRGGDMPILEIDRLGRTSSVSLNDAWTQQNSVLATDAWKEEDLQVYDQSSSQWRFYWTSLQLPVVPGGHDGAHVLLTLLMVIFFAAKILLPAIGLLLLTAKSDPFLGDDKEEDGEARQRKEVTAVKQYDAAKTMVARGARLSPVGERSPKKNAKNRWKRAQAGINTTFLISKVLDEGQAIDLSTFVAVNIVGPGLFEMRRQLQWIYYC